MAYLIPQDYFKQIQDVSLQQIISGNSYFQTTGEIAAQAEIISYLTQKYDTDKEFTNTTVYNPQATYNAADRVYLDADPYSSTSTYTTGRLVLQNGIVYQCITAILSPEAFTAAKWVALGAQYDIFYANYPYPLFDLVKIYNVGDRVFWKNRTYTCKVATRIYNHDQLLQFNNTNNVPYQNVFPDDLNNGAIYWTDNGVYVVPAGNLLTTTPSETITLFQAREDEYLIADTTPNMVSGTSTYTAPAQGQAGSLFGWKYSLEKVATGTLIEGVDYTKNANGFTLLAPGGGTFQPNEKFVLHFIPITDQPVPVDATGLNASQIIMTYFTKGDNRNPQMVMLTIDINLYHLYARIAPKNIPDVRTERYHAAVAWLRMTAKGDITAAIEKKQPAQGGRMRYGSNIKNVNSY